jgi:S-adenosylmethionine:tRNA ribosyltransferase-isomerase
MRVEDLAYDLPPELIAQRPAEERELARLMVLPKLAAGIEHRRVSELPELIEPGTLVVLNDTRVLPARLLGRKRDTGGRVEVLLVRRVGLREIELKPASKATAPTAGPVAPPSSSPTSSEARGAPVSMRAAEVWRALGKASKPLKFGSDVEVAARGAEGGPAILVARLLRRAEDDGLLEVALWTPGGEPVEDAIRACGHVPLPPYIKREDEPTDAERYQTVYARHDGAVAAPTAGLHLTNALLGRFAVRGCDVASVTLHVGLGTFQPVTVDDLDKHAMHAERYTVSQSTADAIARARARGAPVLAIGTTTVRALESAADPEREGCVRATTGETRLLVQPGHPWRVVDAMLTNFHLPRSTLLALVCAFGGTERVLDAYRAAVRERYRFYSYGDAMLLWRSG